MMNVVRRRSIWRMAVLLSATAPIALSSEALAQVDVSADLGSSVQTREELENLLALYEDVLQSPAYSDAVKRSARVSAERIRERLEEGDFKLGDGVVLFVEGEPDLPDTVAVQAGPRISLPLFGDISLRGVLRSEVEEHITTSLSQFIHDPRVRARALMRVSVQGAVGQPGFYEVPADMLLSQTLMVAGGPAQNSNLDEMRIERGVEVLMEGAELQEAVRQGLTLDQLNLQAGDQVVVPEDGGGFWTNIGIVAGIIGSLSLVIFQVAR